MSSASVLQSLYLSQIEGACSLSTLDDEMKAFILRKEVRIEGVAEECCWQETVMSAEATIINWKRLLTVNLLNDFSGGSPEALRRKVHAFQIHPWNQTSQFFRLLVALNHALAKMPVPEPGIHLLESGAALIELQEHSPWLSLPYHPRHLEFGVYLCAFGLLAQNRSVDDYVKRLIAWQLNALDANGLPIASLFVQEKDGDYFELLLLYYLLFRGAAQLTGEAKYSNYSQQIGKKLVGISGAIPKIDPLWVLLENLFVAPLTEGSPLDLPCQIYDSSTSLIGYRSEQQTAVCTLHGGHTGLGYIRYHDVEIVNYGPQYFPLDDCRGFGIEGNHLSDHGIRRSLMEWNRQGFSLKGCVRLVDQPAEENGSPIRLDRFRGIWMDVGQEFKSSQLHLKTSVLGLDGWEGVGFSFFVKADQCQVGGEISLLPGRLNHYEGEMKAIKLCGKSMKVEIKSQKPKGRMQVIPLSGGNNFWGANFLVAYLLDSQQRDYAWTVKSY